jgi:hypothetical protein
MNQNVGTAVVGCFQGDQIGRIFAHWFVVLLWLFFGNYRSSTKYCGHFFNSASYVLILTRHGLGYILGGIFTNSSGHPGCFPSQQVA